MPLLQPNGNFRPRTPRLRFRMSRNSPPNMGFFLVDVGSATTGSHHEFRHQPADADEATAFTEAMTSLTSMSIFETRFEFGIQVWEQVRTCNPVQRGPPACPSLVPIRKAQAEGLLACFWVRDKETCSHPS